MEFALSSGKGLEHSDDRIHLRICWTYKLLVSLRHAESLSPRESNAVHEGTQGSLVIRKVGGLQALVTTLASHGNHVERSL